jgi:hypothetical protein
MLVPPSRQEGALIDLLQLIDRNVPAEDPLSGNRGAWYARGMETFFECGELDDEVSLGGKA